jgi:cyclic dehypoxanthinyl futalosine synthase
MMASAQRLSFDEGLHLFRNASIEELRARAQVMRNQKNPPQRVTFVLDSNPNYTNICNADCSFCAFYRHPGAKDSYEKTVAQTMQHMEFARQAGLSTVLLQGGLNDNLKMDYYVALVKTAVEQYPDIYPHFFSAPELWNCARVSGVSIETLLQALWEAGQRSIPGGGAEILSEKVRLAISPKKMEPGAWIVLHKAAHRIGFRTTATMMYGHVEEPEDILIHLDTLRQAQDEIPGFTAFIPWSYKYSRTALRRTVKHWAGVDAYLRILAFSRVYLDNFDHIQASWFGEGKMTGVQALGYGADDFGGIMVEENVHRATGFINKTDHQAIIDMIRQAGFEPAQRDPLYRILRTYAGVEKVDVPDAQRPKEIDRVEILFS